MRVSTHLFKSGASFHITIPKQIREALNWQHREELMVEILEDKSVRIVTLDQYVAERVRAERRPAAAPEAMALR